MQTLAPITLQIDAKNQLTKDLKSLLPFVFIPLIAGYSLLYFFIDYTFIWLPFFTVLGVAIFYLGYLIFQDSLPEQVLLFYDNHLEIRQGGSLLHSINPTQFSFCSIDWQPAFGGAFQAIVLNFDNNETLTIGSLSYADSKDHSEKIVHGINYYITSETDWERFNHTLLKISDQEKENLEVFEYEYKNEPLETVLMA